MKTCHLTTDQSCNPATLPKATGQHDHLFRAIFDGVGHSKPSGSAFQAVADGLSTYGRATHCNWDFDARAAKQQGNKATRPISKAERRDKRQDGSWVRDFVPANVLPCYPVAKQDRCPVIVAAGMQGCKRFTVETVNRQTGDREEIRVKLVTNTIFILTYGQTVEFSMTSRSKGTFLDGRDGKRKPLSFAKSELRRFLGITEGNAKFAELTTFPQPKVAPLSPCNPPNVSHDDTQPGHTVAGLQPAVSLRINPDGSVTGLDRAV